jgi:hypothetical protein|tara:strand:+ start:4665 stop:5078 length:414 start_codon:yes stop_codon:yes gene_type:complete
MNISLVPPPCVFEVWEEVASMLEKSIEMSGGRWSLPDVHDAIMEERFHLWVAMEKNEVIAAATTSFTDYPRCRMLTGQFLGGTRLKGWMEKLDTMLEKWGRDHGCMGIELTGRNGWARALKAVNWSPKYTVMEKSYE